MQACLLCNCVGGGGTLPLGPLACIDRGRVFVCFGAPWICGCIATMHVVAMESDKMRMRMPRAHQRTAQQQLLVSHGRKLYVQDCSDVIRDSKVMITRKGM